MSDSPGPPTPPAGDPSAAPKSRFRFPTAFTVLFLVLLLVWIAAFFVPAGKYQLDSAGSPRPGTYHELPSCSAVEAGGTALVVPEPGETGVAPADAAQAPNATVAVPGEN